MRKFRLISATLIIAATFISAMFLAECSPSESAGPGEYALILEGATYEIGSEFQGEELFASSELTSYPVKGAFPAMNIYKNSSLEVHTFVSPEDQKEEVIFVHTSKNGETSRGVRIGDALANLKAAYPEVLFLTGDGSWADEDPPVAYSRIYRFFMEGDGTNNYMDFYTDDSPERKVVLIEAANSLDAPREWNDNSGWLGDETIKKEMPDGFTTRLFRENQDGSETEIAVFYGAAESHDHDNDGMSEVVCFTRKNNTHGIVIVDKVGELIINTDVNTALGSGYSEYTGVISNIKSEYSNCIEAVRAKEGGTVENLLYSYKDGGLEYLCTLQEALR